MPPDRVATSLRIASWLAARSRAIRSAASTLLHKWIVNTCETGGWVGPQQPELHQRPRGFPGRVSEVSGGFSGFRDLAWTSSSPALRMAYGRNRRVRWWQMTSPHRRGCGSGGWLRERETERRRMICGAVLVAA